MGRGRPQACSGPACRVFAFLCLQQLSSHILPQAHKPRLLHSRSCAATPTRVPGRFQHPESSPQPASRHPESSCPRGLAGPGHFGYTRAHGACPVVTGFPRGACSHGSSVVSVARVALCPTPRPPFTYPSAHPRVAPGWFPLLSNDGRCCRELWVPGARARLTGARCARLGSSPRRAIAALGSASEGTAGRTRLNSRAPSHIRGSGLPVSPPSTGAALGVPRHVPSHGFEVRFAGGWRWEHLLTSLVHVCARRLWGNAFARLKSGSPSSWGSSLQIPGTRPGPARPLGLRGGLCAPFAGSSGRSRLLPVVAACVNGAACASPGRWRRPPGPPPGVLPCSLSHLGLDSASSLLSLVCGRSLAPFFGIETSRCPGTVG